MWRGGLLLRKAERWRALDQAEIISRRFAIGLPTGEMSVDQFRDLVKEYCFQVNFAEALFKRSCAMSNDLSYFIDKYMVWCDLRVPRLYKLLDNHRDDAVKLKINVIRAC